MTDRQSLSWFWAKLGTDTWPTRYHPVVCHLIDVGQVAHALWQTALRNPVRSRVTRQLGLDSEDAAGCWIAFWIAAHDIGKLTPCFQSQGKTDALKKILIEAQFNCVGWDKHHTDTGTKVFHDLLVSGGDGAWPKIDRTTAQKIAVATGGHHGTFPTNWSEVAMELGNEKWAEARLAMLKLLAERFGDVGLKPPAIANPDDQSVWMFLAGLTSIADWIGSNTAFFPPFVDESRKFDEPFDVDEYFERAKERAERSLKELGWLDREEPTLAVRPFAKATGISTPRPLQDAIIAIAEQMTSPQLVIVEAPMGEGKTEAAWYVADCWDRRGGAGTYVALPTMATSNQMFGRVEKFLNDGGGTKNFMLMHGKASLNEQFEKLKFAANVYDEGSKSASGVVAEEWFAKNKKHGLLAPYGVGTIDQVLLAVLQTKHVFVRLFGLAGKCVILDEVHAYDAYMTTLMKRLLRWLAALGCPVVLLSATLPAAKRAELLDAYAGTELPEPARVPYPRITTVAVGDLNAVVTPIPAADPPRKSTVHLRWLAESALVEKLKAALKDGGCAAVIRNTVGLAQKTYMELKEKLAEDGIEVELFHARFPFGRRQEIETTVLDRYGKGADGSPANPKRPTRAVLVATQVIEQSLDLDFDVMVSDVAPVDLVLQRAGRLHRHARGERPSAVGVPTLWLIEPGEKDGRPDFGASEWVYDAHVLFRSLMALRRSSEGARHLIELPLNIDGIIREVYSHADIPTGLSDTEIRYWDVTKIAHEAIHVKEEAEAEIRQIKKPSFSGALARIVGEPREEDSPELHPAHQALTRLTRPTIQLICLFADADGTLRTPHDLQPVPMLRVRTMSAGGSEDLRRLLNAELGVADMRVLRELWAASRTPAEWGDVGMLKKHQLVVFTDGVAVLGGAELRLDMQLGLQVTRSCSEGDE
jgi:CRISPR-associated endonuclease/helicase Cas3